jgi:hypothetical protein
VNTIITIFKDIRHEANIRDGGKTVHFVGRSNGASPPHHQPISLKIHDISFKDDETAVLLLNISFMIIYLYDQYAKSVLLTSGAGSKYI